MLHRESLLWKNLIHDHIVPFLGVADDVFQNATCMITLWMDNGNLTQYIRSERRDGKLQGNTYVVSIQTWVSRVIIEVLR